MSDYTTAARIRDMNAIGHTRQEIAEVVGRTLQHVRQELYRQRKRDSKVLTPATGKYTKKPLPGELGGGPE